LFTGYKGRSQRSASSHSTWHDAIAYGNSKLEALDDPQLYIIIRTLGDERAVMLANLSSETAAVDGGAYGAPALKLVSSNYHGCAEQMGAIKTLRPWEVLIFPSSA
jgi:hypothetical protein